MKISYYKVDHYTQYGVEMWPKYYSLPRLVTVGFWKYRLQFEGRGRG